ncbi:hypothetical protein [Leptospira bandrabouensis]|uniref:Phage abortive infection protein n=1 Tax=Leptospira bandrabouensis TaxID=2484903 RepID=A0A6H3NNP2_9LEPT|nr:hypothetical protein [Leptospira bandrabouensis]MCG6153112.1 hypothetical protein [Leptospira bandrabouensis]TGN06291.1 hypothetical protein EHR07_17415 [Leptospira bandrabouensis]TGN13747.1 hypothetical protein EHR08_10930 [Leptospira bandrabouensis]
MNKYISTIFLISITYAIIAIFFISTPCLDGEEKTTYFSLLNATLPLGFSIIIFLLESNRDKKKDLENIRIRKIEEINKTINSYNTIILKSIKRINSLASEFVRFEEILKRFNNETHFKDLINYWRQSLLSNPDANNIPEVRELMEEKISIIAKNYLTNDFFKTELEYLSALYPIDLDKPSFDLADSLFVFQIREKIAIDKKLFKLFSITIDILGDGNLNRIIGKTYNNTIESYKSSYKSKTRAKEIDEQELTSLLCSLFIDQFNLIEKTVLELTVLLEFIDIFSKNFIQIYSKYKEEFGSDLAYMVNPKSFDREIPVNKYIRKETVDVYYQ